MTITSMQKRSAIVGVLTNPDTDANVVIGESVGQSEEFTDGITANKCDSAWQDTRTLDTTSEEIDVFDLGVIDIGAGAGKDPVGQDIANLEIVGLRITSDAASVGELHVGGGAAASAWNTLFNGDDDAILVVQPGGYIDICAPLNGYSVADTTNHTLKIEAVTGLVTYTMTLLGRSTDLAP